MPVNRFKDYSPSKPHLVRPGGLKGEVQDLRKDLDDWSIQVSNAIDAGTDNGITELTGDVTAGPGNGSQAATVARIQGYEVATATPINGNVLAWSAAQSKWVPGAPAAGGGSGGVTLYLNGSTAATAPTTGLPVPSNVPGTIVQELGTTGQVAAANVESNDLTQLPGAYDLVASFVTPLNAPGVTSVPAGLWNFNIWASSSGTANQTVMQARVFKYDGATAPTLIATSDDVSIYDPALISQYLLTVVIPAGVTLLATDRLYVELRGRATNNNRRITFQFGDGTPTHVTTTLPSAAGGDLSGTFPNPTVAKLQGNAVSSTAPTSNQILQWISGTSQWTPTANGVGLGSRVHLVVEGGAYASLQAAVTAASANDVILVGPKGTVASGSWGDVTFPVTKRLSVIGLNGARGTSVRIGKVTFSPVGGTGNITENEVFLRSLFINADFSGSQGVLFGGTALARLRMTDCFVYNSGASGDCVVMNNAATGGGTTSSLQLDGCTIQAANATSVLLKNTSGYTVVRDCSLDGGFYSLQGVAGVVECFKSFFEMNAAAREAVRVESAQVTMTWCRIINSNATGIGANITTAYVPPAATALFGMNNSVFLVGGVAPTTPYCVKGVAGALYAYGQVTYGVTTRCQNTLIFSQSAQVHTSVA